MNKFRIGIFCLFTLLLSGCREDTFSKMVYYSYLYVKDTLTPSKSNELPKPSLKEEIELHLTYNNLNIVVDRLQSYILKEKPLSRKQIKYMVDVVNRTVSRVENNISTSNSSDFKNLINQYTILVKLRKVAINDYAKYFSEFNTKYNEKNLNTRLAPLYYDWAKQLPIDPLINLEDKSTYYCMGISYDSNYKDIKALYKQTQDALAKIYIMGLFAEKHKTMPSENYDYSFIIENCENMDIRFSFYK